MGPEIKVKPPGPKARAVIEKDTKYASPSYIKEYPLVVDHGEGAYLIDVDGNRYLDFMAGIAVSATGYRHPAVTEAVKKAADKFLHVCFTDFYYESGSDLCERLSHLTSFMGPTKVFLSNSGTEAVEGAIKLARFHTKRSQLIAFQGAFHGRTTGAIALNSSKARQRAFFGPLMPGVHHVPFGNLKAITDELFVSRVDPKEVAAILVEPILGEGGYVHPPASFLQGLRAICDQHGIVLVFDEIQSGVGRTGKMFAAEAYGVVPDVLLLAKGLGSGMPIGAIVAKNSVMTWTRGTHGSTFGGNPVACAAALATLDVVSDLLPSVEKHGEELLSGLRALQKKHSCIGDVRGRGFMIGVEFLKEDGSPDADLVGKLEQKAFENGLLLLSCGVSTIRLAPPLVVGSEEIRVLLQILDRCLTELA